MFPAIAQDSAMLPVITLSRRRERVNRSYWILLGVFAIFILIFLQTCFVSPIPKYLILRVRWASLAGTTILFMLMRRHAVRSFPLMLALFYFVCFISSARAEGYLFSLAKLLPATLTLLLSFYLIPAALDTAQYKRLVTLICWVLVSLSATSVLFGLASGRLLALKRFESLFYGPNTEGVYMGFGFFAALWLWAAYPASRLRIILQFAIPGTLVGCYATSSRSSFFGLLVGGMVWGVTLLVRGQSKRRRQFIVVLILLGVAILSKRSFFERGWEMMMREADTSEEFFESRMWIWEDSWRAFHRKPFLGHGYGVSALVKEDKEVTLGSSPSVRDGSGYLGLLESVGILGCTAFGLLVLQLVLYELHLLRRRMSGDLVLMAHGMSAMTAFLLVNHVGEPWLLGPGSPTFQLFWFFMGAAFYFNYLARTEDKKRRKAAFLARLAAVQSQWQDQQGSRSGADS